MDVFDSKRVQKGHMPRKPSSHWNPSIRFFKMLKMHRVRCKATVYVFSSCSVLTILLPPLSTTDGKLWGAFKRLVFHLNLLFVWFRGFIVHWPFPLPHWPLIGSSFSQDVHVTAQVLCKFVAIVWFKHQESVVVHKLVTLAIKLQVARHVTHLTPLNHLFIPLPQ